MALDDPNITKIIFYDFGEMREVEVATGTLARLACVIRSKSGECKCNTCRSSKWHVEIIDCAPGIYTIQAKKRDIPNRKIWFETILRKNFKTKKKKRYS